MRDWVNGYPLHDAVRRINQHAARRLLGIGVMLVSFHGFVGCWIGLYAAMISFNIL